MSVKQIVKQHPRTVIAGAVVAVGLAIFVLVWFQPQKLIIEQSFVEDAPTATRSVTPLATGSFRGLDHETSGRALLLERDDGSFVLRLEDLQTSNGPDLRVYLSPARAEAEGRALAEGALDIGALKGNRGSQNYVVPAGTDVTRFRSVVIWCRRFTVGFGVAALA